MIFASSCPCAHSFLFALGLAQPTLTLLLRCLLNCFAGGHTAADAADVIRTERRHRAQIVRYLHALGRCADWATLSAAADLLLRRVLQEEGTWVFILDQTYHTTYGVYAQNTFSRANKKKPSRAQSQRQQHKTPRHTCHCFVFGLLISPQTGTRLPYVRSYFTKEYCTQRQQEQARRDARRQHAPRRDEQPRPGPTYTSQTDLAAALILGLSATLDGRVLVLGDTAFDGQQILDACTHKNYDWVVPANPERVLAKKVAATADAKPRRPKLRQHCTHLHAATATPITLVPGLGRWATHQRGSKIKAGKQRYARRYWAQAETLEVHNVGRVQVVFSTTNEPTPGSPTAVQKVLLCNRVEWDAEAVVAAYAVRWQIEQFFKEMKSELGLSRYRLRSFVEIQGWVEVCCVAFVYLEWYRLRTAGTGQERAERLRRRTQGLAQAVRQEIEERDMEELLEVLRRPKKYAELRAHLGKNGGRGRTA